MPDFSFESDVTSFVRSYKNRGDPIWTLKLNDEWTIVYVVEDSGIFGADHSMEIHRKNTAGELTVSGKLAITRYGMQQWEKKFSNFFKTGSSFKNIGYVPWIDFKTRDRFRVHLRILDNNSKSLERLLKDFERLLDPKASCFADVTLKCDGTSIPAHKNILSARSPVFEAMFANLMKESLKNEVDVTDIDINTLRALLVFVYTGKTDNLTASSAADLLFAADKYQLLDLKSVCSDVLAASVSLQNVLKLLILGDLHCEDLKSFAVDYIRNKCADFSEIDETEEWKSLREERPSLAKDVLTSIGIKRLKV